MENLKTIVPKDYSYLHLESNSDEEIFCIKEVTNGAEADEWMRKLSSENKTTWRVSRTYPKVGYRIVYRKDYRCQHSTDRRATGAGPSKNTNCPAKLNIIIRRCRKQSKPHITELVTEYPAEIILKEAHNHPIVCAETLRYRDMSEETRQRLSTLFQKGHSAASALSYLKLELMFENPDNYYKVAADSSFLPSSSIVGKLFKKECDDNGYFEVKKQHANIEELFDKYHKRFGGTMHFQKTADSLHSFGVIMTPLMMRCHREVRQCSELVLMDASGGMNKSKHRTYMFATPTVAGGLPLGIIITDCEKDDVFTEALFCYKELLSESAFFSVGYPQIILTNSDMRERSSLKKVFPNSTVFLSQLHILKLMWQWLCFKKNNINPKHRQNMYFLFKRVVSSIEVDEANANAYDFMREAKNFGYLNLEDHFLWLWEFKTDWATCFRKKMLADYSEPEWRDVSLIFQKVMNDPLTADEQFQFQKLVERISDSISSNPCDFVPAVEKMLNNAETFASTDNGLINALRTFGTSSGVKSASQTAAKNLTKKSRKILIAAQARSALRRKQSQYYLERKKSNVNKPKTIVSSVPEHLQQHNYTSFGSLPKRKKTSPHNLEQFVLENKTLSGEVSVCDDLKTKPSDEPSVQVIENDLEISFDASSQITILII